MDYRGTEGVDTTYWVKLFFVTVWQMHSSHFITYRVCQKNILTHQDSNGLERVVPASGVNNALTFVPINNICIYYSWAFVALK